LAIICVFTAPGRHDDHVDPKQHHLAPQRFPTETSTANFEAQ